MDNHIAIRAVAAIVCIVVALGMLALVIAYIMTLSKTLEKCAPASRTMQPGMVWLLLVPMLNLVWNFLVVNSISDTLTNEFRLRGIQNFEPNPGKQTGMTMAICGACSIIPILGILAALVYFVTWILYWVKVSSLSKMLDQSPAAFTGAPTPGY